MCVYSMIHQHFQTTPSFDFLPPGPYFEWTLERWQDYQRLLKLAAEYDARMGQPDCPDPEKDAKYKEIAEYIAKKFGLTEGSAS